MKSVAFLATLLLFAFASIAQPSETSIYFKQGSQLQYRFFVNDPYTQKMVCLANLQFNINSVSKNGDTVISQISKLGYSSNNAKHFFQKLLTVKCIGNAVLLPADFFLADTVFESAVLPKLKQRLLYSTTKVKESSLVEYPGNLKPNTELKTFSFKGVSTMHDARMLNATGPNSISRVSFPRDIEAETKVTSREAISAEDISTPAGDYPCIKIESIMSTQYMKTGQLRVTSSEYYHEKFGVVRSEQRAFGAVQSYIELVEVHEGS